MPATPATTVLRELAAAFPVPQPYWHAYVGEMRGCLRDFEAAISAVEADGRAARVLDQLVESTAPDPPVTIEPGPLGDALGRLARLPAPDGEHPFIAEIIPTLRAMRAALLAVAASPVATRLFAEILEAGG